MATRDRTALFLRYREEARALHRRGPPGLNGLNDTKCTGQDDFQVNRFPDDDDDESYAAFRVTRGGMEPEWVFAYNDLKGDMVEIENLLEQLAAMYAQHLLPSFGEKDTSQLEHDIRGHSHRLTESLHAVERKVREVGKRKQDLSATATGARDVELEIRHNIQKRFATPLQELSVSFRKRQKAYFDKLREVRETYAETPASSLATTSSTVIEMGGDSAGDFDDSGFTETQLLNVENASSLAQERTRELNRVAANINDLATIVKDIASLVVDQGTVLDRIDYNLEEVKTTTFAAVRELRTANRYQRKRHALCCILILALACGLMFIILVYKWTS